MLTVLFLTGVSTIVMSLTWGIIFFIRRKKSMAFLVICFFFMCIAFTLLKTLFDNLQLPYQSRSFHILYPFVSLSIPVLYLLYIYLYMFNCKKLPQRWYLLFAVPFTLGLFSGYVFYFYYPSGIPVTEFYAIMNGDDTHTFQLAQIVYVLTGNLFIFGLCAGIMIPFWFINTVMKKSHHIFHDKKKRQYLLLLLSISTSMELATIIYHYTLRYQIILNILWLAGISYMGYLIYKNSPKTIKRKGCTAPPKSITKIKNDLLDYFSEEGNWRTRALEKKQIASYLGTNEHYVSDALKELNTTYPEFINQIRVAEAERLMKDPNNNNSLTEIAEMAGFNSYNTFSEAFKKEKGICPQEMKKNIKK